MNPLEIAARSGAYLFAPLLLLVASPLTADEPPARVATKPPAATTRFANLEKDPLFQRVDLPDNWREHPLAAAVEYAHTHYDFIRDNVRDFTCVLVKRERINGRLRAYEYLAIKVRRERTEGDQLVTPYSAFTQYLGPAKLKGRKVLYVAGQNDGKMLVRNGGARFSYVTVSIEPDSEAALRESRYPITELSPENVARRLIETALADICNDPDGENTEVTFFRDARVDERNCTQIRVVHPQRDEKFGFHKANIYVDDKLHVPIRIEGYDWPAEEDEEPVLLEEYTYTKMKLNVGLTDSDFDVSIMDEE